MIETYYCLRPSTPLSAHIVALFRGLSKYLHPLGYKYKCARGESNPLSVFSYLGSMYVEVRIMKCSNPECSQEARVKYCSRSCSVTVNNRLYPKNPKGFNGLGGIRASCRKVPRNRKDGSLLCACGNSKQKYSKECVSCYKFARRERLESLTLAEATYTNGEMTNRNLRVRDHARSRYKHEITQPCEGCGYSKHVEICHVRAIADFPLTATIAEVNARENIRFYCPNCHWEFDRGLIT